MNYSKALLIALVVGLFAWALLAAAPQIALSDDGDYSVFFGGAQGGYLGMQLREVRSEDVASLKLPAERGAVVEKVVADGPAAKGGLKENDVIVEFDGENIHSAVQLTRLVRETPVGRDVKITVLRDGQRTPLTVKLTERKGSRALAGRFPEIPFKIEPRIEIDRMPRVIGPLVVGQPARLGIQVQNLTEQLAEYFKVPGKTGVLVASVSPGGPAEKAGLKAGDVITGANGKTVAETHNLTEVLRDRSQNSVKLDCIRQGQKISITVNLQPAENKRGEGIRL
jgi:serine protease Do